MENSNNRDQSLQDSFLMAITGESMVVRPFSMHQEKDFLEMIDILRKADLSFTHLEMLLHNHDGYPGKADWFGGFFAAEPQIAEELVWSGIDLVSCAHNHCWDYAEDGVLSTIENLDIVGLVNAGMGRDLEEAREPAYIETNKGRVALISLSSGHKPHEGASLAKGPIRGRPGCNYLRFSTKYVVKPELVEKLKQTKTNLKLPTPREITMGLVKVNEGDVYFLRNTFTPGEEPDIITSPHKGDLRAIIRTVKEAKKQADIVLVSHHYHAPTIDKDLPPTFVPVFAKACIDAGADVYIGTGAHRILGIEIYKDKPIFYSMGNFFAQSEFLKRVPPEGYEQYAFDPEQLQTFTPADYHDARIGILPRPGPDWWSSYLAQLVFSEGKLTELKIHPLTLGREGVMCEIVKRPTGARTDGRPMLAKRENGNMIMDILNKLSSKYGTQIDYKDEVGVIKL
jgi:poly-gamma-glutamate synthesis protein (capsule biosynthesis protein)